ncbi:MAG: YbhB/YbcL family Raf kinase inhibitor-like protein [Caulobacterales bacterium]
MRHILALASSLLVMGCGQAAPHQEPSMARRSAPASAAISLARVAPKGAAAAIAVSSAAVGADGSLDLRHSAYGANLSPPLTWTPATGAGAYAVILEDPDAPGAAPFVHWVIWNIPGTQTSLAEGLSNVGRLASPQGALQGRNDAGGIGYFGPRPPAGTGVHHYHVQVFALDGPLSLTAESDPNALVGAMQGRVLADGELIATFAAPPPH